MGEDEEDGSCNDLISELPDLILHHILSFLSAKSAAKTSIISKRWRHVWETFPVLDCYQLFFGKYLDIINPKEFLPKDTRRNIYDQRVKFMSYIDEKLRRLHENDLFVTKFRLVMTLVSVGLFTRVDSWLDWVIGLSVQELDLCLTVGREKFYGLPMKVFASESLTILRLKGCILIDCGGGDDIKLPKLVDLHLQDTIIDEKTILNLISSIDSLEVFSMKECVGFTYLEMRGHEKLKKVVFHPHGDLVQDCSIYLTNLEELDFGFAYNQKKKYTYTCDSACPNLKHLSLYCISIDVKCLQTIAYSFPRLESLFLGGCGVKEPVKLSSSVLKEVYLRNCSNAVKAEFDTPGLHVFKYCSKNMSRLLLNNVIGGNRIAELRVPLSDMDRSWFLKLNNFLRENQFQELILSVTAGRSTETAFIKEDFIRNELPQPQPTDPKSMKLVMHAFTSVDCAALLNGLFWILHPSTLKLELNYNSPEYVKGLLKSLVAGEEPKCCRSVSVDNLKCWRHSLKGIKFVNVKGFKTGTPLNLSTLSHINNLLDNWAIEAKRIVHSYETIKGDILSFDLSWQQSI